ncbi:MAG: DNA-3-methyladenine glycosylase [Actinomycetota bacterium]
MTRRFGRAFYARPATEVARELLGQVLVGYERDGTRLAARVVETEAYLPDDEASHSFRGPTDRNRVMFGRAGLLYVYFTYGMHHCMNAVTGPEGEGSAVLLRAAEPIEGMTTMAGRRGSDGIRNLCSGPAKLCQAFGVDRTLDGVDLVTSNRLSVERGAPVGERDVATTTRVGVSSGIEHQRRFVVVGDPFVSTGRPAS